VPPLRKVLLFLPNYICRSSTYLLGEPSRASQEPVADEDDGGEDAEGGPKILTKKEKEKLKKEKEKVR
jgi:hypothetical protein